MTVHAPLGDLALINPNTNGRTTRQMTELARECWTAGGGAVHGFTANRGPSMIIDPEALAAAVDPVREAAREARASIEPAAIVIAAIGDPGRWEVEAESDVPVVGIGEAAILAAARQGARFGMATTTDQLVGSLEDLVASYECGAGFTGVELTEDGPLELAAHPEEQYRQLLDAVQRGIDRGAETMIIAGGPLSQTARQLRAAVPARIVEPIPEACKRVERVLRAER